MGAVIEESAPSWRPSRRLVLWGIAALAGLILLAVLAHVTGATEAFEQITKEAGDWAYLLVFLSVFGDAIIPIFPSETALSTASALAADGSLRLGYVILAGSLGAVLGDSALYWIAHLSGHRLQPQIDKAKKHEKVAAALEFMGSSAPLLIVAGRYVPGVRFAVNATMGIAEVSVPPLPSCGQRSAAVMWSDLHVLPRLRRLDDPQGLPARVRHHLRHDHDDRDVRDLPRGATQPPRASSPCHLRPRGGSDPDRVPDGLRLDEGRETREARARGPVRSSARDEARA